MKVVHRKPEINDAVYFIDLDGSVRQENYDPDNTNHQHLLSIGELYLDEESATHNVDHKQALARVWGYIHDHGIEIANTDGTARYIFRYDVDFDEITALPYKPSPLFEGELPAFPDFLNTSLKVKNKCEDDLRIVFGAGVNHE